MKRFLSVLVAAVACAMNVAAMAQAVTDLSVTNSDGVSTATPGGSVTYTITASNAGPNDALGSTVADTFPASLTCSWSCVGTNAGTCAASGYGNINDTVNLPNGGSVTYTANCSVSAGAKGSLSNTAMVIAPGGITDSTPGNNSATDTDTFAADLSITNTDGVTTAIPGGNPVVYTVTASNAGPGDAPGSTVADTFPAGLTCTWTCVGASGGTCTASGSGNINNLVNLPLGGSVTYTASCTAPSSATGSLINTATVTGTVNDPVPANNSATDTDALTPQVNLSVTNTDNSPTAIAGKNVFYTIRASNQNGGPSDAPGSIVTDVFPAPLVCTWTCSGTGGATCAAPSGSGNINSLVNLPKNGRVTFSATCALPAGAAPGSSLNNTATVATAAGITETTPADNTLSDIDTVVGQPDLSVTVSDGVTTVNPGDSVTYTMTVANGGSQGPSNAPGTSVVDTFPSQMACTWTCSGVNATCLASGSGNIHHTLDLPTGSSITYIAHCTVSAAATGTLVNVITATPAAGMIETLTGNNAATDSDVVNVSANIALTMTDDRDSVQVGDVVDYVIDVTNPSGPAMAIAEVIDVLPTELGSGSWTCTPSANAQCNSGAGGTLVDIATIPIGGKVEYVYSAVLESAPAGDVLSNTASASLTSGSDPATGDNSATDNDSDIVAIFGNAFDGNPSVTAKLDEAGGQVSAQLQVDSVLLHELGVVPVDIANGRSADGRRLFTIQIARFGQNVVLRTLTTDAGGMNAVSEWQTVDLGGHVLELAWQSASAQKNDGYFAVGAGGTPVLIDGRTISDQLSYLQITVENNVPWLTLIEQ